ncbi:MAG: type I methionyl aminopeptidase [Acidimicrobiales bacterium]
MRPPKANEPCWCGSGTKFKRCHGDSSLRLRPGAQTPMREVPDHIERPPYADSGKAVRRPEPRVKSPEIIERMRRTGKAAAQVLANTASHIVPGITTDELDAIAHAESIARDAYPSPLNYQGFPKSLCTSVNEVICHGIPDDRALREGDIVNLDVTVFREGVHGDTDATFLVGEVDPESQRLVRITRESMERGIDAVKPGRPISDIGQAIQDHAEAEGYGVVRDFIGHGIGEQFHTDLQIPHYYTPHASTIMEPGMTFTIEPMITMGSYRFHLWPDGWTAVTTDGLRTAQFEHTILVTDDGPEVLTEPD